MLLVLLVLLDNEKKRRLTKGRRVFIGVEDRVRERQKAYQPSSEYEECCNVHVTAGR